MTIKLIIVDDQNLVRQGINSLLQLTDTIEVVAQLDNGGDVVSAIDAFKPDIILLDIRMPKMSGIDVLKAMEENELTVPVLILTTFDEHDLVLECLQHGAKGYLRKDVSFQTLVSAITSVANGEQWIQPAITENLLSSTLQIAPSARDEIEPLTSGEKQVLQLIAAGYSNQEIAEALHKSAGTIRNTVSFILAKLQVRDRTRAVIKALENGIIS